MQEVFDLLKAHADPETAVGMATYQRNQFPFLALKHQSARVNQAVYQGCQAKWRD